MKKLTKEQIFNVNCIESEIDVFSLSRQLSTIPRSHTLPDQIPSNSVAVHTLNCLFLVDFLNAKGHIMPKLSKAELFRIKEWLQYHDIQESLVGDIPYHIARIPGVPEIEKEINLAIKNEFESYFLLSDDLLNLAKIIDALEFYISILGVRCRTTPEQKRIDQAKKNVLAILNNAEKNSYYTVQVDSFLEALCLSSELTPDSRVE